MTETVVLLVLTSSGERLETLEGHTLKSMLTVSSLYVVPAANRTRNGS